MKKILLLFSAVVIYCFQTAIASDDHDHDEKPVATQKKASSPELHKDDHADEKKDHDDHGDEKGEHAKHEDEHEEGEEGHEEGNNQVGPTKGILEAEKGKGFKLSPEAEKNFEIQRIKVGAGQILVPKNAIVTSGEEINIFRLRGGFYSRIDFKEISKSGSSITIKSKDLMVGDEIVIKGIGFLRMTEIAAFDGAPAGHSH